MRTVILLLTVLLVLLIYAISQFMVAEEAPAPAPAAPVAVDATGAGDADSNAAALPDTAAGQDMIVEQPIDPATPAPPTPDARQPNRWYYVNALGDGPGVIYSRTGGQWNFAFACTTRTRAIEFIAVGTGAPGDFDKQAIRVGKVKLMMDASYSQDGGGTIISVLPATHAFFNALDGTKPMEIQLHATRKTIVPIGPAVIRLIKTCRGGS
ncbi:hypothetical protein [Sphingomonas sp. SRS2]|uniref:hypothetical protein n=1 Tax=Sphingomonas sp. SRS2 TaxID=133190 RepID=UPI00128BA622|nr:hypothetical protein [Sphingomonas sp. SRS2]